MLWLSGPSTTFGATDNAQQTRPLKFTVIPREGKYTGKAEFETLAKLLSKALDRPVQYVPSKTYRQAIELFQTGQIQLGWFGALSGLQARHDVPNSRVIATSVEDRNFQTYLITSSATKLPMFDQLDERVFRYSMGFVTPESTSGYLMPLHFLESVNKKPLKQIKKHGFSGDHFRMMQMVEVGHYDLGWVDSQVWHRYAAKGLIDPRRLKLVWLSPPFVDGQWSLHGEYQQQFGDQFVDKLVKALLDIREPSVMGAFQRSQFIEADNSAYDSLLPVARRYQLLPQQDK